MFGVLATSLVFGLLVFVHSHDNFLEISMLTRFTLPANNVKHKRSLCKGTRNHTDQEYSTRSGRYEKRLKSEGGRGSGSHL